MEWSGYRGGVRASRPTPLSSRGPDHASLLPCPPNPPSPPSAHAHPARRHRRSVSLTFLSQSPSFLPASLATVTRSPAADGRAETPGGPLRAYDSVVRSSARRRGCLGDRVLSADARRSWQEAREETEGSPRHLLSGPGKPEQEPPPGNRIGGSVIGSRLRWLVGGLGCLGRVSGPTAKHLSLTPMTPPPVLNKQQIPGLLGWTWGCRLGSLTAGGLGPRASSSGPFPGASKSLPPWLEGGEQGLGGLLGRSRAARIQGCLAGVLAGHGGALGTRVAWSGLARRGLRAGVTSWAVFWREIVNDSNKVN